VTRVASRLTIDGCLATGRRTLAHGLADAWSRRDNHSEVIVLDTDTTMRSAAWAFARRHTPNEWYQRLEVQPDRYTGSEGMDEVALMWHDQAITGDLHGIDLDPHLRAV
jgi:cytidylate kinase